MMRAVRMLHLHIGARHKLKRPAQTFETFPFRILLYWNSELIRRSRAPIYTGPPFPPSIYIALYNCRLVRFGNLQKKKNDETHNRAEVSSAEE